MITTETNLKVGATTQLPGHDFNSYCRFGEHLLACRDSGLCSIGGSSGVAEAFDSYFETFIMDLGYAGNKRLRFIYLGIETEGKLIVTPTIDGVDQQPITFSPGRPGKQFMRMPVNRAKGGAYVKFKVQNVGGCWFAIDQASVLPIYLPLGRR
jgi:hypothetical protein